MEKLLKPVLVAASGTTMMSIKIVNQKGMTNSTLIMSQSQISEDMAERLVRLEHDNAMLRQENDRLNREVAKIYYKVTGMRKNNYSHSSVGQVILFVCLLSAVLLTIYGMGYIDFPSLSSGANDYAIVETLR